MKSLKKSDSMYDVVVKGYTYYLCVLHIKVAWNIVFMLQGGIFYRGVEQCNHFYLLFFM
jgi:hypothetical protein